MAYAPFALLLVIGAARLVGAEHFGSVRALLHRILVLYTMR